MSDHSDKQEPSEHEDPDRHDPHRRGHGTGHKFDITRLERLRDPERLVTMNPDTIWEVLAERPVHTLVDIGVGIGFFAIPFAREIPDGKIYGCDIKPEMLDYLRAAMASEGVDNIEPVLAGEVDVPLADEIADVVLMVNLHHELDYRDRTLGECRRLLKPGGRVAVIDWKAIETEKGPPLRVRIPPDQVKAEMEAAGFHNVTEHDVLPQHYFVIGQKPVSDGERS